MTDPAARLERALLNPGAVFRAPDQVAHDPTLSREDKLAILSSWEEDARELAVAEEENMAGGEPSRLAEVVAARSRVEGGSATPPRAPSVRDFVRPAQEILHADHEIDEAALRLSLQDHPILPVADGDEIVGVLGPADLDRALAAEAPTRLSAREVMTAELTFCYLDDPVVVAHALLDRHGGDHLLVIDAEGTLAGILDRTDLPPASEAGAQAARDQDLLSAREENAQGIATTSGGLDVYDERPTIKRTPKP
jgi:CBS domain-containing protein